MTYDWEETLQFVPASREWFEEVDRRFLTASCFAQRSDGAPFSRSCDPSLWLTKMFLRLDAEWGHTQPCWPGPVPG